MKAVIVRIISLTFLMAGIACSSNTPSGPLDEPSDASDATDVSDPSDEECVDTNGDALDSGGDDCTWYDANPDQCGEYDDDDFVADAVDVDDEALRPAFDQGAAPGDGKS